MKAYLPPFFLLCSSEIVTFTKSSNNEETFEGKLDDEKGLKMKILKFKYKRGQTLQSSVSVEIRHLDSWDIITGQ